MKHLRANSKDRVASIGCMSQSRLHYVTQEKPPSASVDETSQLCHSLWTLLNGTDHFLQRHNYSPNGFMTTVDCPLNYCHNIQLLRSYCGQPMSYPNTYITVSNTKNIIYLQQGRRFRGWGSGLLQLTLYLTVYPMEHIIPHAFIGVRERIAQQGLVATPENFETTHFKTSD